MDRNQKNELISSLKSRFDDVSTVVVAYYAGLTVSDMSNLRSDLRAQGASLKVVKNRLAKIAVSGTSKECLLPILSGPTVMAFSSDPVSTAKIFTDFAKNNEKLIILGGALDEKFVTDDEIKILSKLPSLDALRGKLIGLIQAPATKLAAVSAAPAGQIARLIRANADKNAA